MSINRFFAEILRAERKHHVWSWGAVDPMTDRVYLMVWDDEIQNTGTRERILIGTSQRRRGKLPHGFNERHEHLGLMRKGTEGYGVLCTKKKNPGPRNGIIKDFDSEVLLRLGRMQEDGGNIYARIEGRIPVSDLTHQPSAQSTLIDDLEDLKKQRIEKTMKESLTQARLGQGRFRSQVLHLWSHRCAVTRSATDEAIRASHIKPWRESTNEERLDPENGIPLVACLDTLFDRGLISFDAIGRLLISSRLNTEERRIFPINRRMLAKKPCRNTAEYLVYHRKNVFVE